MSVRDQIAVLGADAAELRSTFDRRGRAELVATVSRVAESLGVPEHLVCIVGEYESGKSSVLRSLLDGRLGPSPASEDSARIPLSVRNASAPSASATVVAGDGARTVVAVEPRAALRLLSEARPTLNDERVIAVDIAIPHELLEAGIVLIDTPSSYGPRAGQAPESLELAQTADCVIFVSDASQPLTSSELIHIDSLRRLCGQVILVLTKVDLYPDCTRVGGINRDILSARQLDCEIVAVSCELAKHAFRANDPSLLDESGVPQLRSRVVSKVFETRLHAAAAALISATDQYLASLERERDELSDPEAAASHVKELQAERDRLARLKEAAPLWQQRLGDGYERLVQDTDHLCLTRTRALVQEVGDLIDAGDPVAMWPEWQAWLLERVQFEQALVVEQIRQRADGLDVDLADYFRSMLGHDVESPSLEVLSPPSEFAAPTVRFERTTGRRHLLNAMKATSGNVTMFSVLSVMAGISLGPLALAPAGFLARNALRDERKRGLERNRMLAKAQASRFCEDVRLATGRVVRVQCQMVRIALRDHYQTVAADLMKSVIAQLAELSKSMQRNEVLQRQRKADIEQELTTMSATRDRLAEHGRAARS